MVRMTEKQMDNLFCSLKLKHRVKSVSWNHLTEKEIEEFGEGKAAIIEVVIESEEETSEEEIRQWVNLTKIRK